MTNAAGGLDMTGGGGGGGETSEEEHDRCGSPQHPPRIGMCPLNL